VKRITTAIVLASTLLAGCSSSSSATDLDSQAFANKISEPGVVILDVRTSAEFAAGHIEGAINIDVEGMQFESGIAVDKMSKAGFTSLFNLQTGIADWQANGFPVTL
jgi:rhodanese-related sulfurtransferase